MVLELSTESPKSLTKIRERNKKYLRKKKGKKIIFFYFVIFVKFFKKISKFFSVNFELAKRSFLASQQKMMNVSIEKNLSRRKEMERAKTFTNLDPKKISFLEQRTQSAKIQKYGHHTKRQSILDKIKGRINKIAEKNLNFYKIKQKQEKDLKNYLNILERDQSYKRKVQSKVFVNMLINQHHGDAVKMRKKTENQRRNYYKRTIYKKCVEFYYCVFNSLAGLIPIMVNGLEVVPEIVEYLRLILLEGEVLKSEDNENIQKFIEWKKLEMKENTEILGVDGDGNRVDSKESLIFFFRIFQCC